MTRPTNLRRAVDSEPVHAVYLDTVHGLFSAL